MINFRFHIVSLTAVLLALGVGLVLGTAFLDEAVVDALHTQLDDLEGNLDQSRERSNEMETQIASFEEEHQKLDEELDQHVLAGELAEQPVLVVSSEGVDDNLVPRVFEALADANAQTLGAWKLSGDLTLDNEDKVERLAGALDLSIDDAERLHTAVVSQLGDVLWGVTDASQSADPQTASLLRPQQDGQADGEGPQEPHEPAVLKALRDEGFVDYEQPEGVDDDVVRLPPGGVRVVLVTDSEADVPDGLMLDVLTSLASDGRVPVVVPSPTPDPDGQEGDDAETPPTLVEHIRGDDGLASRVSTVDNLERAVGKVATVLALQATTPGDPVIGHYGQGEGAERLLPPPEVAQ